MTDASNTGASRGIVVTGARGYIGNALVQRLAQMPYRLRLVSRFASATEPVDGMVHGEHVVADLSDDSAWLDLLADADAIVHLSSRTDLRAAEADPGADEALNVEPVRALVRAAAKAGVRPKVVFASAVTVVGMLHDNPVNEKTPDHPCSVYDRHKLTCETILRQATAGGLLSACSLRLPNVYGPGTSVNANRGILNMMMRRALNGEALTLYAGGTYVRDFIYLDDVVEAFAAAVAAEVCDGSHYVIASGRGHSLAEAYRLIADEAFSLTGRRVEIRDIPAPADMHAIERRNFIGNSSLYRRLTGWQPRVTLREGICRSLAAIEIGRTAAVAG